MNAESQSFVAISRGLKYGAVATGSLALTWAATEGAVAADAGIYVDPARFADAFNSFSVGVGGGFNMFRTPIEIGSYDEYSIFGAATTLSGTGAFATAEVGRDFRFGDFVLGAYADFHTGGKTGSFEGKSWGCYSDDCAEQNVQSSMKLGHGWGVNARAGVMMNPSTLVYGLLGFAWQNYTATMASSSDGKGLSAQDSASGTLSGHSVGVGVETILGGNPNFTLKGEYRLTHLGNGPAFEVFDTWNDWDLEGGQLTGKTTDHLFRVVLSMKFGGPLH